MISAWTNDDFLANKLFVKEKVNEIIKLIVSK